MKLLVFFLAVGLSSAEKLNRVYLPPPGAKYAGGNSENLQTPLAYPEKTEILMSGNDGHSRLGEANSMFTNGLTNNFDTDYKPVALHDKDFSKVTAGNLDGFSQTIKPELLGYNIGNTQNIPPGLRYPVDQHEGMNYFGNDGYHFGNPGNMPIIAVSDGIMANYHPNAFGMYGGSPMLIKTYSGEETGVPTSDRTVTSSTSNLSGSSQPKSYQPTAVRQKNYDSRNQVKNTYIRPERLQAQTDRSAVILDYENILTPDRYSYSFDTSNGIHKDESATTVNGVKALGSYSYTGDDGKVYSVIYSADENGFQPRGDHLPTPPPIPEAIQKVIEQAKRDKQRGIFHDGSYDEEKYGHMKYQGPITRYLQEMKRISILRNRNRVVEPKNINTKPVLLKYIKAKAETNILRNNEDAFKSPINNLNSQFGMRKALPVKHTNVIKNLSRKNTNYRLPVTSIANQNNSIIYQRFLVEPSIMTHDKENIAVANNEVPRPSVYLNNKPQDAGYYYVPPINAFIERRFKVKPETLKTASNQFRGTNKVLETKSIPVSGSFYPDQQNNHQAFTKKIFPPTKNYITNTKKPDINKQTYENDVYLSTTQDFSQSNNDFGTASTTPSSVVTMATQTFNGDTLATSAYNLDYTEGIDRQEETVFPEVKDKSDIPTRNNELDQNNVSTTPMSAEIRENISFMGNPTQYKTFDHHRGIDIPAKPSVKLEHDGYFKTMPQVPATFEDLPAGTYVPFYSGDGAQVESNPIIKVDGFGRPIQDNSQLFNANKPNYGYFHNGVPVQDEQTDDKLKSTTTFFNFEEPLADKVISTEYDELVNKVSDDQASATTDDANERIIGEEFSGPKQPQKYDPDNGYFY